ncbi:transposase zinc-binding domain-containing protein [Sporolactobacillus sp. CQH2019]|uniref:IS91 family transposase n=1 Tax=Sporolactobacillus sp. CQH2019 TaxID=3023512 RepID=UPI0023682867|nr:transposase zinc-binding domain-containing protein [Sporolactobacillus sp. CQH2019]MDD9146974.1 transposase zinc-binding domain-containing protein [Sporolactobacillus sp. CQH2019]
METPLGSAPEAYRGDIRETVQKAIKCGTRDLGYAKYECLGCEGDPVPVFVCLICKSCFCHKCGKKYTDDWSDKQQDMIFDVPRRHLVFTVPKDLRNVFYYDRSKLNELSRKVAEVFKFYDHRKDKKRQLQVGVITVIHTFGRDLKFNPHVHTLVTEETLDNRHEWRPSDYISYDYLLNRKEKPAVSK